MGKLRKRKGIAESGALFFYTVVISAIATMGAGGSSWIFSGGNPASSAFFMASNVLTVYSQMPHVKRDFREEKAMEEFGYSKSEVQAMSDEELLNAIRDDAPGTTTDRSAWSPTANGMLPRLGG